MIELLDTSKQWEQAEDMERDYMVGQLMENDPSLSADKAWEQAVEMELSHDGVTGYLMDIEQTDREYTLDTLRGYLADYQEKYSDIMFIAWVGERYSHYGAIGGGGASCHTLRRYQSELNFSDHIPTGDYGTTIEVTDEGHIELTVYDHDGNNTVKLVVLTTNMIDSADREDYSSWDYVAEDLLESRPFFKVPKRLL